MEYSKYIIIGLLSGLDTWPYFKRLPGTTYPSTFETWLQAKFHNDEFETWLQAKFQK